MFVPWKESYDKLTQRIKKQRHHFADHCPYSQSYGFPSSHVQMWELHHKWGWALQNWCFKLWCWRRLWRVPWTARRSKQSILKEINPEYSLERLMLKLQCSGHLTWRADSLGDSDAREYWWQKEKGAAKMVRQHPRVHGHEFEQTPEDSGEERRLVCPWGPKESDTTKQPNNNSNKLKILLYSLLY